MRTLCFTIHPTCTRTSSLVSGARSWPCPTCLITSYRRSISMIIKRISRPRPRSDLSHTASTIAFRRSRLAPASQVLRRTAWENATLSVPRQERTTRCWSNNSSREQISRVKETNWCEPLDQRDGCWSSENAKIICMLFYSPVLIALISSHIHLSLFKPYKS